MPAAAMPADVWARVAPGDNGFTGRYWKAPVDGEGNIFFLCDGDPSAVANGGGIDVTSADGTRTATSVPTCWERAASARWRSKPPAELGTSPTWG